MLVCVCNGISDRDIDASLQSGAKNFREIRRELGIASDCGQCGVFAKELINEKLSQNARTAAFHLATALPV